MISEIRQSLLFGRSLVLVFCLRYWILTAAADVKKVRFNLYTMSPGGAGPAPVGGIATRAAGGADVLQGGVSVVRGTASQELHILITHLSRKADKRRGGWLVSAGRLNYYCEQEALATAGSLRARERRGNVSDAEGVV